MKTFYWNWTIYDVPIYDIQRTYFIEQRALLYSCAWKGQIRVLFTTPRIFTIRILKIRFTIYNLYSKSVNLWGILMTIREHLFTVIMCCNAKDRKIGHYSPIYVILGFSYFGWFYKIYIGQSGRYLNKITWTYVCVAVLF